MTASSRARAPDRRQIILRRVRTVPAVIVAWAFTVVTFPALLLIALTVDAIRWLRSRTHFMAVRLITFGLIYLTSETIGIVALAVTWVAARFGRDSDRLLALAYRIQRRWAMSLFRAVEAVFGLEVVVHGADALQPAPFLLFGRHASIVDNLLPARFIAHPLGTHIRYVLKRELLVDPCLDIAGNRLPNVFVRRGAGSERDLAAIGRLADMYGNDAVLIYPEGTRFTIEKRDRALDRLARSNERLHALAADFQAVIPPKLGGVMALLESCAADVVVMAHRGLDGFARVADIWRGAMVGAHVDVGFWRVPRSAIPDGYDERAEWMFRLWGDVDRWVRGDGRSWRLA